MGPLIPSQESDVALQPTVRPSAARHRPAVRGKFLYVGDEKLYVRGVTYGPFRPDDDGSEYHDPHSVRRDFAAMRSVGVNAVRVYTVPPRWLLDLAAEAGLYVMVGLPWEQHVTFLDERKRLDAIEARVRQGVRACRNHPAVLCYAVGNEIPASIVRWHGRRRIERFLQRLYDAAKSEDPDAMVTYVNFPTTEYLQLHFMDLMCCNVYLESQETYEAYLARLQNLAKDKPLLMAEIGLDSRRNGEDVQAVTLDWQIRTTYAAGCAGMFVFAWTDEWHRGGCDIDDWDFGLTARDRSPKAALESVRQAFEDVPFSRDAAAPRMSVVVCTYNGSRTLRQTLSGLARLEYPDYEVIVVDDGSTDSSRALASEFDVRLISTENRGLSSARNTGLHAATGEIVVYLDDDAYPDSNWLSYYAYAFAHSTHAAVGGPNLAPADDGFVADCVDHAPGNPVHILLSDTEAEHIPGCNMAFRREALRAIGGFDAKYRIAGDDVDVCWRLQAQGYTIGFHPGALVWHHRRRTVRTYWRQQKNYGRAEALLEMKWPEKYNAAGHLKWAGRIYANGKTVHASRRWRVYYGIWGTGLFQSIYETASVGWLSATLMPEWYLVIALLTGASALGWLWPPLFTAVPFAAVSILLLLIQAHRSARQRRDSRNGRAPAERVALHLATMYMHLMQPLARLVGRMRFGLAPWRSPRARPSALSWSGRVQLWSEQWHAPEARLCALEAHVRSQRATVERGDAFDRWDLQVYGGLFGRLRVLMAAEEHGAGRQLLRFRIHPKLSLPGVAIGVVAFLLACAAGMHGSWPAAAVLGTVAAFTAVRLWMDCAAAASVLIPSIHASQEALSRDEHRL